MKAFWTYTLARFAVFAACFALVWLVVSVWLGYPVLISLLVALIASSVISFFALGRLRDRLALEVQGRAERMTERIEESRRAEDID